MYFVRAAAAAMKTSGEAMISYPPEWCSPIHTSSKPRRSRCSIRSRSRSRASVGFCPVGWNGAMNSPKRIAPLHLSLDRLVKLWWPGVIRLADRVGPHPFGQQERRAREEAECADEGSGVRPEQAEGLPGRRQHVRAEGG